MRKNKILLLVLCTAFMFLGLTLSASALMITPSTTPAWTGTANDNLKAAEVAAAVGFSGSLSLLYKQDRDPATEEGDYASSYTTAFYNTSTDPADAIITYVDATDVITGFDPLYLLVKDGNNSPYWYIFNLLNVTTAFTNYAWNGIEQLDIIGFWPSNGAISHVSIYGNTGDLPPGPNPSPEPATLLLLGLGMLGLVGTRRNFKG
ncbi:MAG TPA: PEP-CTERM sorting domain-containing protein [Smithellaceae bacterium]|nr:PEP-CTERM sorting domain-containing protein [Smithellaceae bacterium]